MLRMPLTPDKAFKILNCHLPFRVLGWFLRTIIDTNCRMYIFNSKDLCLIEDLKRFKEYGINSLRIEAGRYLPEEIQLIVTSYKRGLQSLENSDCEEILAQLKSQLEQKKKDIFTKGHYYRGVL